MISFTCQLIAGVRDYHKSGNVPAKRGGRQTRRMTLGTLGQWECNHREYTSRGRLVRFYPATSFTGEMTPFSQNFVLYSIQLWSCPEVQKLFLPVPSHPALSGQINLFTSGTKKKKKMQLAKGYISLSQAQGSKRTFRMEGWKEEDCLHMAPGQPGLIPGSWFFLVVYFLLLKMHLPMESKMLLNLFPHAKQSKRRLEIFCLITGSHFQRAPVPGSAGALER